MKKLIVILMILIMSTPVFATDVYYTHDLGDGSYVATTNRDAGEWIVAFYYWLQDVGIVDGGAECAPNY